ncbi:hypothetical protein [Streptomyces sp. NPDC007264]|uniref:hypothetical protein n=1 Tax=Streptomyces sp. NPDC007264 TaxID=3364777 RepID=UPI0036DA58CB
MRRRTEAVRGMLGCGRTPARAAVALCTAALGMSVALPARAAAGAAAPVPYAFDPGARTVQGATGTAGAVRLDPGRTYRSSLPAGGKRYYRLDLDATATAYVSATAVPQEGAAVSSSDGLKVSVQDADGTLCSSGTTHVGPTQSPHPIAASAARETGPGTYVCGRAGVYYAVVEQRDLSTPASGDWDLELDYVSEPALNRPGSTAPPSAWNSAAPQPLAGEAKRRAGGAGFAMAGAVGQGVWQGAIRPGQTVFYKVPVDWGQQLSATAELGGSTGGDGYVGTALAMALYNPVRAHVADADAGYSGARASAALDPLPPVDHANRHAVGSRASGMRFAGWYYLAVHLGAPVADRFGQGPFGLTLRVRVGGTPASAPAYAGRPAPRDVFEVTAADRQEAAAGTEEEGGGGDRPTGTGTGGDVPRADGDGGGGGTGGGGSEGGGRDGRAMKLVAVSGIGTGSLLVLGLAVWTLAARRRAGGGRPG